MWPTVIAFFFGMALALLGLGLSFADLVMGNPSRLTLEGRAEPDNTVLIRGREDFWYARLAYVARRIRCTHPIRPSLIVPRFVFYASPHRSTR